VQNQPYNQQKVKYNVDKINKCSSCEQQHIETVIHHIVPKAKGGRDNPGNLVELCLKCHGLVHGKDFVAMRELQKQGIERAKADGVYKGRIPKFGVDTFNTLMKDLFAGMTPTNIDRSALSSGEKISRASIYRVLADNNISLKKVELLLENNKYVVVRDSIFINRFDTIDQAIDFLSSQGSTSTK
jgi:hypothetical protein